jgi:N-acetylmuramoyl-L-alanine amidase
MYKNIILDFGHGGIDENGNYTTAPYKMFKHDNGETAYEGVINRQIGGIIRSYLRLHEPNFKIITTVSENDPRDLSLSYRVRVANELNANETVFISIHSNASGGHNGRGFEIYTTRGRTKSDELATNIGEKVKNLYERIHLKLRFDFFDADLDKEADFYVLKKTSCPAVLLECLFFDNWDDYQYLKNPEFQRDFAWHVYQGILAFVQPVAQP